MCVRVGAGVDLERKVAPLLRPPSWSARSCHQCACGVEALWEIIVVSLWQYFTNTSFFVPCLWHFWWRTWSCLSFTPSRPLVHFPQKWSNLCPHPPHPQLADVNAVVRNTSRISCVLSLTFIIYSHWFITIMGLFKRGYRGDAMYMNMAHLAVVLLHVQQFEDDCRCLCWHSYLYQSFIHHLFPVLFWSDIRWSIVKPRLQSCVVTVQNRKLYMR